MAQAVEGRRAAHAVLVGCGVLALAWIAARGMPPLGTRGTAPTPPRTRVDAKPVDSTGAGNVDAALNAYERGNYQQAEAQAQRLLDSPPALSEPKVERQTRIARARWVLAYSAARRREFSLARERFAQLENDASQLPGGGSLLDEQDGPASADPGIQAFGHSGVQEENGPGARWATEHRRAQGAPPTDHRPNGQASLEEDAAYEHAVLTGALGQKQAAEAELKAFMRRFPESPLLHAAIFRIRRYHGGNAPADAEAVWQRSMKIAQAREAARQREVSKCAPEVLAELLAREGSAAAGGSRAGSLDFARDDTHVGDDARRGRRGTSGGGPAGSLHPGRGGASGRGLAGSLHSGRDDSHGGEDREALVEQLAREMKTDARGTTLKALADACRRHGISARGVVLSWKGLEKRLFVEGKPEPVVAWLPPGHFVLLDEMGAGWVRVWDPDGNGPGQPSVKRYYRDEWLSRWDGTALVLG